LRKDSWQANKTPNSVIDDFAKSLRIVKPDLIWHPEQIEFTGFRLSPE